jgi:uncharacterized membrane protein YbhN (UPF0104 family)
MNYRKLLWRVLLVVVISLAGFLLYRTLSRHSFAEIVASVRAIPGWRLALAFGCAIGSYACLTVFDALGVRYAGKPLPYWKTALTSFVSLSIGHNIGVAALSSGAIRYRFYSRWGLTVGEVAKVILFSGMTVGLGLATLGGIGLLVNPGAAMELTGLGGPAVMVLGTLCLSATVLYLILSLMVRSALHIRNWTLELPPLGLAAAQVAVGSVNFAFVAGCLYQTLAAFTDAGYLKVSSVYVIANTTALVSHVPGGLGVLEAAVVYLLSGGTLIGALVAFRTVYFFVPLGCGLTILLISERNFLKARRARKAREQEESQEPA